MVSPRRRQPRTRWLWVYAARGVDECGTIGRFAGCRVHPGQANSVQARLFRASRAIPLAARQSNHYYSAPDTKHGDIPSIDKCTPLVPHCPIEVTNRIAPSACHSDIVLTFELHDRIMDLSPLESLGKIAGLGGIALGVVVVLVRPVIDRVSTTPPEQRASLLRLITIGTFGVGALGIVAWLVSGLSIGNVTASGGGVAAGRDINGPVATNQPPGGAAPPSVKP